MHGLRHLLRECQTEAGAVNLRRLRPCTAIERLEDVGQILGADISTTIRDADAHLAFARRMLHECGGDAKPSAFTAVLQRVADEVLQDL